MKSPNLKLPDSFGSLTSKTPIYIDVYYVDRKLKIAYCTWDFGMDFSVHLHHPFYPKSHSSLSLKEKIISCCKWHLEHAFTHYNGDPNYEYYHWALYGMYKDIITVNEQVE